MLIFLYIFLAIEIMLPCPRRCINNNKKIVCIQTVAKSRRDLSARAILSYCLWFSFVFVKMLRRNIRRILKYSFIVILLIICGLLFFKSFMTIRDMDSNEVESREKYSGLPKNPDQQKVLFHFHYIYICINCCFLFFYESEFLSSFYANSLWHM